MDSRKKHWETIYDTKQLNKVSWYQPIPQPSLNYIKALDIPKNAEIIDIGGGDSFLVDFLLKEGYTNISVLDISEKAIERAKLRLGSKSDQVIWIVSDITEFKPTKKYDLWHDRAVLHFLTLEEEIQKYVKTLESSLSTEGKVIIGTFSENGPTKCSGIKIKQYSKEQLTQLFTNDFSLHKCENIDHETPFNTIQNFTFCHFQKNN